MKTPLGNELIHVANSVNKSHQNLQEKNCVSLCLNRRWQRWKIPQDKNGDKYNTSSKYFSWCHEDCAFVSCGHVTFPYDLCPDD